MKRLILGFVFILLSLYFVLAQQATGEFEIGNSAPTITAFQIQDGVSSWDGTELNTHDSSPNFRWNLNDLNSADVLSSQICIGTSFEVCDLDTTTFNSLTPGQQVLYSFPSTLSLFDVVCPGNFCSKIFYAQVNVTDGQANVSQNYIFNITNNRPNTPIPTYSAITHNQTPTLTWIGTDPDDGSVDKWPADSLFYLLQVGTSFGDGSYENNGLPNPNGEVINNPIPWGVPGATTAVNTVYVKIIVDDAFGFSSSLETTFDLVDNLPQFENLFISDSTLTSSESCVDFLPQNCVINPLSGNYTSVNINLVVNDTDGDCSAGTHSGNAVLCLVDASGAEVCNPTTNANYSYPLVFAGTNGNLCNFTISVPLGDSSGIEFFTNPGSYKIYVDAFSQSGMSTDVWNYQWQYSNLMSIKYTDIVHLGDRIVDGGDGIQLNEWNPGLFVSKIINQGNTILNFNWTATDPSSDASTCSGNTATCWDLSTSPDLQIDDDINQVDDTGNILSVSIPETPLDASFNPIGGLQVCDNFACNTGINEFFNTTFHIRPPTGLSAGVYQTNITYITTLV